MGAHGPLKIDPAIEGFDRMREQAYKGYRFNRRTATTALIGAAIVPISLYYLFSQTDNRYKWNARLKGQPLDTWKS